MIDDPVVLVIVLLFSAFAWAMVFGLEDLLDGPR